MTGAPCLATRFACAFTAAGRNGFWSVRFSSCRVKAVGVAEAGVAATLFARGAEAAAAAWGLFRSSFFTPS